MMLGVSDYLWRLIPGNPILRRVVESAGKRKRDLLIRCVYLGLLVLFVIFTLFTISSTGTTSLTDLSNASRYIFQRMSYLQLLLVSLLAPIFTAGAITQEKDSQTYDILLATPLTNGQIVLGSLLSRLFFVLALLVSGIPIFSATQIFGGVGIASIALSFTIAAATAMVTGATAMAIATFKVGTRRTIFSFYLFIVVYIFGLYLLDTWPVFQITGPHTAGGQTSHISWFTGIHPFLAMRVILADPTYQPPDMGMLPLWARSWPLNWYFTDPASAYITITLLLSLVLVAPSIVLLRRLAQSTNTLRSWTLQKLHISKGDQTRKPRNVWLNPIAWREAKTKGSATRASFVRWAFMILGIAGAIVIAAMHVWPTTLPAKYIAPGSYDPDHNSLFIHGDQVRWLANDVRVSVGEQNVNIATLGGRYEVVNFELTANGTATKQVSSITLSEIKSRITSEQARAALLGAVAIEFSVVLLIVTNAAASTVTREKEDGSLDLLLTTPITSRYYIWGKLRGLIAFVLPLLAVPVISVAIFVIVDLVRSLGSTDPNLRWTVLPEAILIMPPLLIIVAAFASILGMQMSLRSRTTVRAVMSSVGIVTAVCGALVGCGQAMIQGSSRGSDGLLIFAGFSPFTLLSLLINPTNMANQVIGSGPDAARSTMFVSTVVATLIYGAIIWAMYQSMVKNFDMTIRRQSR